MLTKRRFRVRFDSAFPKNVPHLGPQDIEAGVSATEPSEAVENLLCGLLGLVLNRKKNPEYVTSFRLIERSVPWLILITEGAIMDALSKTVSLHLRDSGHVRGLAAIPWLEVQISGVCLVSSEYVPHVHARCIHVDMSYSWIFSAPLFIGP